MGNHTSSVQSISVQQKVLLIDTATSTRSLRAKALRERGLEVVCAGGLEEGRALWQPNAYRLVLMHLHNDAHHATEFGKEILQTSPNQLVAFLVGGPEYLSSVPAPDGINVERNSSDGWTEVVAATLANGCRGVQQRNGILEAAMRISAARSCQQKTAPKLS